MEQNYVALDEAKFKKTSKKLLSFLEKQDTKINKISEVQELLAKSLGYRNLHDLQKEFSSNTVDSTTTLTINSNPFNKNINWELFSASELTQIFTIFLTDSSGSEDMWQGRAISLISSILIVLKHMEKNKEINISIDLISEHLVLENIINLYKRVDFPNHIKQILKAYLISLPGFQESAPKQSSTTFEQHSYLQMQFTDIFRNFKQIENNNITLFDINWVEQDKKSTLFEKGIVYYSSMSYKDFESTSSDNPLFLNPQLLNIDFIEVSWLFDSVFLSIINSFIKKNKLNTFKVSDLIIYCVNSMTVTKQHEYKQLIKTILKSYSSAEKLSNNINKTLKKNLKAKTIKNL